MYIPNQFQSQHLSTFQSPISLPHPKGNIQQNTVQYQIRDLGRDLNGGQGPIQPHANANRRLTKPKSFIITPHYSPENSLNASFSFKPKPQPKSVVNSASASTSTSKSPQRLDAFSMNMNVKQHGGSSLSGSGYGAGLISSPIANFGGNVKIKGSFGQMQSSSTNQAQFRSYGKNGSPSSLGSGGGHNANGFTPDRSKIVMTELKQLPGVMLITRTPHQKRISPDRIALDKKSLKRIPIFDNDPSLRIINLQHNQISAIENLFSLPNLIFLDLFNNQIREIKNLQSVPTLRVLVLAKNYLSRIANLEMLVHLDVLDLQGNQISKIENLDMMRELRVLNLSNNLISCITGVTGLISLVELNIKRNQVL